ncbi:uncharacterized protein LOC34619350 [Cyclospora cayetanensis]|uniref:Uncharacterized protein LOC34619350 n=2 Tax=Cyclospora cayetanensis TaxID=88456 RepID=A0A6P5WFH1_9EIME|nr:uncharacterized protein LOC34619350 [Cyclospora cayetanensis]OEH77074.1 hypothetical protein cyc_02507 [Cyclospora cayetanensis]
MGIQDTSPDDNLYLDENNLSADESSGSHSSYSSPVTRSSSSSSHRFPVHLGWEEADMGSSTPFSLTYFRKRSYRLDADQKRRHWISSTLTLLGSLIALIIAVYQLRFAFPFLRKGADNMVSVSSSRPYSSGSSGAGTTESTAAAFPGSLKGTEGAKVAGKRHWVVGAYVLILSLVCPALFIRLQQCLRGLCRWLWVERSNSLPTHSSVEEEFAELYRLKGESLWATEDFQLSNPVIATAIRKSLADYRSLDTTTQQSAFAAFFYLAVQSHIRQVAFSAYVNACDALHAKVEQSVPVSNNELTAVLQQQNALRKQYRRMVEQVSVVLDEKNLPIGLCEQEMEFLIRDFRPALLELGQRTIYSLDMDRKFLESSIKENRIAEMSSYGEQTRSEGDMMSVDTVPKNPKLQDPGEELEDELDSGRAERPVLDDLTSREERDELLVNETKFWEARRRLTNYRRDTFQPHVPDFDRCILPELPLSLFAY